MNHGGADGSGSSNRERADEALKLMFKDILSFAVPKARPGIDPEDLAQEAILRFLEAMDARQKIAKEKSWCLQVLMNVQSDELRHRRRFADRDLTGLSAPEDISAFAVCAYATMDEFRDTLPPGQLKVVDLLLRGGNCAEIAQCLDVSEQYVAKTLSRLRKKFEVFLIRRLGDKDHMGGEGADPPLPGTF